MQNSKKNHLVLQVGSCAKGQLPVHGKHLQAKNSQRRNGIGRLNGTSEELDKLIKYKNIINYIKAQTLSWFGHVQRMLDTRTVKKIFNWKPLTKRSQGRPKYRWEDNIKQDICQMKIKKLDSLRPGSREMERGR